MLKFNKLKKTLALVMALAFCLCALPLTAAADENTIDPSGEPSYALSGTINSVLEIMDGTTPENLTDADTSGQITIALQGDKTEGAIFTAYKLLNIVRNTTTNMLEVSIPNDDSDRAQAFWNKYVKSVDTTFNGTATINDIKKAIKNSGTEDSEKSSSIVKEFVKLTDTELPNGTDSSLTANNEALITTTFGFYAILQTGAPVSGHIASAPVLACLPMQQTTGGTWLKSYTVKPKDDTIDISKQVKATGDTNYKDETITNIGDTVSYEIIADLPTYGADIVNSGITYTIKDILPDGITIDESSISAALLEKDKTNYVTNDTYKPSYDTDAETGKKTLTLSIENYGTTINGLYDKIKITYSATLNGSAVVESTGNINKATLTYSSYYDTTSGKNIDATTDADAKVYTMGLDITKIDQADNSKTLTGAEFEVYTENPGINKVYFIETVSDGTTANHYRVATQAEIEAAGPTLTTTIKVTETGTNKGKLMIDGLNDMTYYLKETKAPTGYNLPTEMFAINVQPTAYESETKPGDYTTDGTALDFDENRLSKNISNSTGIDLPVTGGMGTVIFTAIGLLLMAGAAYFLFKGKKSSN
ncbi:MAG: SpaH/EbpB family LPXTG-anchored major pilin [Monoglobaceae bacterium]